VIAVLGLLALFGQLGEGSAGDWSAVYRHTNLGSSAGLAAVGLAAFSVTMAAGRMAGDAHVDVVTGSAGQRAVSS
jgi:hypothetical protein